MKFFTKRIIPMLLVLAVLSSFLVVPASAAWYKDSKGWFYLNEWGQRVKNAWQKDSVGWCYLDGSGYMVTNKWVQDSKGWCYIGADGYCLTNCWAKDSVGWVYLDKEGSMVYNQWILDGKWYYVGADGYMVDNDWVLSSGKWYFMDRGGAMVTNQWRKDSKGWCWLGADGAMATNAWVQDSKGWCYVEADGYCATNCWKQDSVGWCYLDSEGSMIKNDWVLDGGKWYYLDGEGYMVTGWQTIGTDNYYFYDSGIMAENTTIDGVTIGADGKAEVTVTPPQQDPDKPNPAPETATLTIGLPMNARVVDYDTNALTYWLEEKTGYNIEFVRYAANSTDMATQIATTIAARQELPDIILGANLSTDTINTYGQDGYFADLKNYFRDTTGASQSFWVRTDAHLSEDELALVLDAVTDPETGSIYAVPTVEKASYNQLYQPYINQAWLDKLGLSMPTNANELYNVLKAFKEQDPNGNNVQDEIPLIGSSNVLGGDVVNWLVNMFTYYDPQNPYQSSNYSSMTAGFTSDEYREAMKFVNKLYKEGLLSSLYATTNAASLRSLATPTNGTALCGIIVGNVDLWATQDSAVALEYVALPQWGYAVEKPLSVKANAFITADCDEPSAAFKVLMALWSEEGSARVRYGEYGVNWVDADPDSKSAYGLDADYRIVSEIMVQQHSANWGVTASCFLPYADGENVQATATDTWTTHINTLKADTLKNFLAAAGNNPYHAAPTSMLDVSALENAAAIKTDLKTATDRSRDQFVLGTLDPNNDAHWSAYLAELKGIGLEAYEEAMTNSYRDSRDCETFYGHFYTFATCTDAQECVFCFRDNGSAHGHYFVGENCSFCGAGAPALTDGRWMHDGVTENGNELDRTSIFFNADGTGSISSSFYGLLEDGPESGSYSGDVIEFNGKFYQSMTYSYAGEITSYTVSGDTVTLNISMYGEPTGTMTLKKTGIDRYTVTAITDLILDETITETIPLGSVFIWF